ncbi:MAG: YdcF family protein [Rhodobacter sp.]|nr:YdcF family protein [Paracoccaceae bacterium]MCC0077170.1 YdcF family protein [Rhodobacter sp.]
MSQSTKQITCPRLALILGAAVWPGGQPSPTLARRVVHAVGLYKAGRVDAILGCGGTGRYPPSEAAVIARLCREAGVPEGAIHLEDRSTTTRENLAFAKPILQTLQPAQVVIVTDPYHAPRARLLARQLDLRATLNCPPLRQIGPRQWLRHLPREALALVATLCRLR